MPERSPRHRVVAGLHAVREVLRAGQPLDRIHVAPGRTRSPVLDDVLDLGRSAGIDVVDVASVARLDELAVGVAHQGVVATGPGFAYLGLAELRARLGRRAEPALVVVLDGVTDPHNLGSVARTAEGVGADALVIPERRAAGVSAAAEKAAAGALAHLPVVRVTNLVRALSELGEDGIWSLGLDGGAPRPLYDQVLLTEPLAVVVGSEGSGLARLTRAECDELAHLPMRGHIGSLNASVASAVALYEIVRRRRDG